MRTTGVAVSVLRNSATRDTTSSRPTWCLSARSPERWITGPSAMGSENGTPSSITSAPAPARACISGTVTPGAGSPAVMYGISAFFRSRASRSKVVWILDTLANHRELGSATADTGRLLVEAADALLRRGEILRIDFETGETAAVLHRGHSRRAAPHEGIEHPPLRRRAGEHHALDDLQRLLRRMVGSLRVLAMQARYAPHVLGVIPDLEPLLAHEDRARTRFFCLGVVGNAHAIDVEVVLARFREQPDRVVHRGKLARASPHARHFPVPDDLVDHQQPGLEVTEHFRTVLPGEKNVKAASRFQLGNDRIDPAPAEIEIGLAVEAIRIVAVVLPQAVGRIGDDEIDARVPHASDALEEIEVDQIRATCTRMRAQNLIPDFSATVCMSLSPRPERLTSRILSFGKVGASFAA